jgi:hypothetical protein
VISAPDPVQKGTIAGRLSRTQHQHYDQPGLAAQANPLRPTNARISLSTQIGIDMGGSVGVVRAGLKESIRAWGLAIRRRSPRLAALQVRAGPAAGPR